MLHIRIQKAKSRRPGEGDVDRRTPSGRVLPF